MVGLKLESEKQGEVACSKLSVGIISYCVGHWRWAGCSRDGTIARCSGQGTCPMACTAALSPGSPAQVSAAGVKHHY